ncbi:MAG: Stk1 family PASTA domain-containing Ser/Thr kinase [Catenibacillus sp.]
MVVPGMHLADRYEILEKIGSGGMADVYKAKDHKLNRLVAVKVLKQEFSTDATFVKKFRVEAQSAAGLSHPNIVNVYDVGEVEGIHFIVMELVQGITLKKYIEMKGKLDIKEALNISVQIASGLQAAHDNRIIHRDIKPQNIIMSRDGKVKVTDFGIAKVADSTTVTTNAAGSVHYISPEQARGGYSDAKSDIYSLGITMYEMVTGRVPFDGETNVAVALLHIQGEMVPPRKLEPSIPRSFEKIILKCTQKKPDRRYASARDLIADLRQVLVHPDGEYVVIGAMAATADNDATVVLGERDVNQVRSSATSGQARMYNGVDSTRSQGNGPAGQGRGGNNGQGPNSQNRQGAGNGQRNAGAQPSRKRGYDQRDHGETDDSVNPALEKVMMVLGIVGAVILVIVIFFIIGKAAGLFSGAGDNETKIESMSESDTETDSESQSESESETDAAVEVPNLLGKTESEAQSILQKYNISMSVTSEYNDDYDEGEIFEQNPKVGEKIKKGDIIRVKISKGKETEETKEMIEVPSVEGMTYQEALNALNGIKILSIESEHSDTVPENMATRTDPAAGTKLDPETGYVTLYLSLGKEIKTVSMPQVVRMSRDDAVSALTKNNLKYNVTEEYSDSVAKGKVIRSSVSSGVMVSEGTVIEIVVSLGPKPSETQTPEPGTYSGTVVISDNPIGGIEGVSSAEMIIVVTKPDKTQETLSTAIVDGQWQPFSKTLTSTKPGTGSFTISVDGVSYGTGTVEFK